MRIRTKDGRIVLTPAPAERAALSGLTRELTALLGSRQDDAELGSKLPKDPALARLLPDAIHGDPHAAAELRGLTEAGLVGHKLGNVARVAAGLGATGPISIDPADELAWLKSLTDLRLVLASRLGIEQDADTGRDDTEAERWMQQAYHWLGAVQEDLLAAIRDRDRRR